LECWLCRLGRNDKQLKASLHKLQVENKIIFERISQIEKHNKSNKTSTVHCYSMNQSIGELGENPASKTLEDEVIELKQRIQESEDRMTNTFYQIDHKLRTMTPHIMKENSFKCLDPAHLYSPYNRGGKIEYEFPKIVEEDLPESELKRVQSDHLKPAAINIEKSNS